MDFVSVIMYSINVSDITTSTTPDFSTTTLSSSSNSVGNNTITTDVSGSVPPWAIAVPSVLGFLVIILLLILGYIYYRRRQRNKKPGSYTLETMSSRSDRSSNEEFDSTHGGYSSRLDTDQGHTIWRPVKHKI
ncbi:unnamed protein product [Rotaria socialis]|nr:unnamed protein product [Rotaria socialis]CAF3733688.1 unnamed protein product [Rotaria socialis]